MKVLECPDTGLMLPANMIDQRRALKKVIDEYVDKAVNMHQHLDYPYFLVFHAKFDLTGDFTVSAPVVSSKLPPFMSNQMVFWVENRSGICEMLWMVPPKKPGQKKLKVEFNTEGVAFLQAKGAMSSAKT